MCGPAPSQVGGSERRAGRATHECRIPGSPQQPHFRSLYVRSRTDGGAPVTQAVLGRLARWAMQRVAPRSRPRALSLICPARSFLRDRFIVRAVRYVVLPDGASPMARKNFPAVPAKKKALPRIPRPPSAKLPLHAHPRLIHGFLIRLGTTSTNLAGGAKPALTAVASVKARAQPPSDTNHEGPPEDATFH